MDRRWSPYRYGYDNPIRFIDPDGMLEYGHEQTDRERKLQAQTHVIAGNAGGGSGGSPPPDCVREKSGKPVNDPRVHNDAEAVKYHGAGAEDISGKVALTVDGEFPVYFGYDGPDDWNYVYEGMNRGSPTPFDESWEGFQAGVNAETPMLDVSSDVAEFTAGMGAGGAGKVYHCLVKVRRLLNKPVLLYLGLSMARKEIQLKRLANF